MTQHDKHILLEPSHHFPQNADMSQIPDPNGLPPAGGNVPPPAGYVPPPLGYSPVPTGQYSGPPATPDDKSMGMLCYILGAVSGWLGPLILWLVKKDTSPFLNDQGKEVLNWELTILPVYFISFFMFCIPFVGPIFAMLLIMACGVTNLVFCIMGAVKVNEGVPYRMPFSIKYIK
jgi:hypothetical protein